MAQWIKSEVESCFFYNATTVGGGVYVEEMLSGTHYMNSLFIFPSISREDKLAKISNF